MISRIGTVHGSRTKTTAATTIGTITASRRAGAYRVTYGSSASTPSPAA